MRDKGWLVCETAGITYQGAILAMAPGQELGGICAPVVLYPDPPAAPQNVVARVSGRVVTSTGAVAATCGITSSKSAPRPARATCCACRSGRSSRFPHQRRRVAISPASARATALQPATRRPRSSSMCRNLLLGVAWRSVLASTAAAQTYRAIPFEPLRGTSIVDVASTTPFRRSAPSQFPLIRTGHRYALAMSGSKGAFIDGCQSHR
jgi:hypothetical protein